MPGKCRKIFTPALCSILLFFVISASTTASQPVQDVLALPLNNALARVTKKPFGLKVSPGHSPVTPERFSGYHAGVDFETLSSEQKQPVGVMAICTGNLIFKN